MAKYSSNSLYQNNKKLAVDLFPMKKSIDW
jgi:hypothetical protein